MPDYRKVRLSSATNPESIVRYCLTGRPTGDRLIELANTPYWHIGKEEQSTAPLSFVAKFLAAQIRKEKGRSEDPPFPSSNFLDS